MRIRNDGLGGDLPNLLIKRRFRQRKSNFWDVLSLNYVYRRMKNLNSIEFLYKNT